MRFERLMMELRYKTAGRSFDWRDNIASQFNAHNIQPKNNKPKVSITEGISIRIDDQRANLIIEPLRWAVEVIRPDKENLKNFISEIYNKIYNTFSWTTCSRIGVKTIWIEELSKNFEEAVNITKNRLFIQNDLTKISTDWALPLSMVDGDAKVHFNAGLMKLSQFMQIYPSQNFKLNVPDQVILADIDYYSDTIDLNIDSINNFLMKAILFGQQRADETEKLLCI